MASAHLGATLTLVLVTVIVATDPKIQCPEQFVVCDCVVEEEHGGGTLTIEIDCSEKNLTQVPDWSLFHDLPITWIDLSRNHITDITDDVFAELKFAPPVQSTWIPRLDINNNPLVNIAPNAFRDMKAEGLLLHIERSKLDYFPSNSLRLIQNLTDLFFMYSKATVIPDGSFENMKKLRRLDLSGNKLGRLRKGLFRGMETTVKSLYLNDMNLTEFPSSALKHLQKLWELKLDHNSIRALPDFIFMNFKSQSETFELYLRNNNLCNISSMAFRRAKLRLYKTYLNHNNITNADFLTNPCALTFYTYGFITLDHNPIACDCTIYSILKAGFYSLHGSCSSPPNLANIPWISKDYDTIARRGCENHEVKTWDLPCITNNEIDINKGTMNTAWSDTTVISLLVALLVVYFS